MKHQARETMKCTRSIALTIIITMVMSFSVNADESLFSHLRGKMEIIPPKEPRTMNMVVLDVDGYFTEEPMMGLFYRDITYMNNYAYLTDTLKKAAEDKDIGAVLLNFESPMISWSHVDDIRHLIEELKEKGKKTYAYAESLSQTNYLMASLCDEIIMTPTGSLDLTGLAGETLYYKDLLDMLGVVADFTHVGQYKAAAENMTLTGPSEAEERQTNAMFDSLYEHLILSIATARHMDERTVERLIDRGPYSAEKAKEAGLIDKVQYRDEFVKTLKDNEKKELELVSQYNYPELTTIDLNNPFAAMTAFQDLLAPPAEKPGDAIAIIHINGSITTGDSEESFSGSTSVGSYTVRKAFEEARNNPWIKAIVLRIDSPGGSATASDIIFHAVRKTALEKPVVASMASVAASGGYYVACGADTIIAQPSTITGSIGVVGGKIVYGGLLDKLGITRHEYTRGNHAKMYSSYSTFTAFERQEIASQMEEMYEIFKDRVMSTRKDKLQGNIEDLAQGRVYTGEQALELGLIDQFGGLDEAIKLAAEKAKVDNYHIRILPRPKSLLEKLDMMLAMNESQKNEGLARLGQGLSGNRLPLTGQAGLETLGMVDRAIMSLVWQHVTSLSGLLKSEPILVMMPYEVIVH